MRLWVFELNPAACREHHPLCFGRPVETKTGISEPGQDASVGGGEPHALMEFVEVEKRAISRSQASV